MHFLSLSKNKMLHKVIILEIMRGVMPAVVHCITVKRRESGTTFLMLNNTFLV